MLTFLTIIMLILTILFFVAIALLIVTSAKALLAWFHRKNKQEKIRRPISGDPDRVNHWHLYILKLQDGKYYVGITSKTPQIRMNEHRNGIRTAYWTAQHKPLELIYAEDLGNMARRQAEKRENKMVRACMKERGINNVRGGDLTSTEDYIIRFGYFFLKEDWTEFMFEIGMLLVVIYLLLEKYITANVHLP